MKVLMVTDSRYQSGSWWRSSGPFALIGKKLGYQFHWLEVQYLRWVDVVAVDVVFMHRPYHEEHMRVFKLAKSHGIPVWIDYDDNLLKIPLDNPTHEIYSGPEVHDRIIKMCHNADVVTVSTNALKRQMDRYRENSDCLLLKNAIEPSWFKWRDDVRNVRAPAKRVLWRGSHNHEKDLLHVKDEIIEFANSRPDWEIFFVGFKPWYILEETENCISVSGTDITNYHHNLHGVRPDLVIVPLADNEFNRCKSNIAAIEGAMAGGMVFAPDWEEWDLEGVFRFKNFSEIHEAAKIVDSGNHLGFMEATWDHVLTEFDIGRWNQVRADILAYLVSGQEHFFKGYVNEDNALVYKDDTSRSNESKPSSIVMNNLKAEAELRS